MAVVIPFPCGARPGELTIFAAADALGVDVWAIGLALASGTLKSRRLPGHGEFVRYDEARALFAEPRLPWWAA